MITNLPAPVDELYAWYCVDLCRTMAWHLGIPPTAVFRASTLIHKYIVEQPIESLGGPNYSKQDTTFIAAAALLAVAKIECLPVRLNSIVIVCDRVGRRRHLSRAAAAAIQLHPPTLQEIEYMRHQIIQMEWRLLTSSAFVAVCELPHVFVLVFLRATCKQSEQRTSMITDEERADGPLPLSSESVSLVNTTLALCNDACRSRQLVLHTSAPTIAAAAIHMACEKAGTPMRHMCPTWYTIFGVTQKELHLAVAHLDRVISPVVSTKMLLHFAASNALITPAPVVPLPTDEELALKEAARQEARRLREASRKKEKKSKKDKKKDKTGKKELAADSANN